MPITSLSHTKENKMQELKNNEANNEPSLFSEEELELKPYQKNTSTQASIYDEED